MSTFLFFKSLDSTLRIPDRRPVSVNCSDHLAAAQKPRILLNDWLSDASRSHGVLWSTVQGLLERMEEHDPRQVARAREQLAQDLEPGPSQGTANPAVVALVRACGLRQGSAPQPRPQPNTTGYCDASLKEGWGKCTGSSGDGAEAPYLAEVFTAGLPEGRLPYQHTRTADKGDLARVLGAQNHFVRHVPHSAKRILFTSWCGRTSVAEECGCQREAMHWQHDRYLSLMCCLCRTQTLKDLDQRYRYRTGRRRRSGGVRSAPASAAAQAVAEALALLHTSSDGASSEVPHGVDKLKALLAGEKAGLTSCGDCDGCITVGQCVHVAARRGAQAGKAGARWAT